MKRTAESQCGVVAIVMALLLPVLIGILGIVIDLGFAYQYKRDMQTATDAGAMAGAHAIHREETDTLDAQVYYDLAKNGFSGSRGETRTINRPPLSGDFAGLNNYVEVTVSEQLPSFFMPVLGINSMTISARAVAGAGGGGGASSGCVWVLSGDASKALEVSSGSTLVAEDCNIKVSSCHESEALSVTSGSLIDSADIDVCGAADCSGSTCDPTPDTGECDGTPCQDGEDPLGALPQPTPPIGCTETDFKTSSQGTVSSRYQISPGVYCNGISIESGSHVNFNPGTYYLLGGGLHIASNSSATGFGVSFFNTEGAGYAYQPFEILSGSDVQFTAQQGDHLGSLDGMLFWQDRDVVGEFYNKIESNTTSYFEGTIYTPTQHLMFHSNTVGGSAADWTVVVADTLEVSSGTSLVLEGRDGGGGGGGGTLLLPTLVE